VSSEAFVPYAPLNVLKPIAADIWLVDGPEIRFQIVAGLKLPFPTRMMIVRLPDGALWVHSPTEPIDALIDNVRELGPVRCLVAPSSIHYWWVPDWKAQFPDAEVFAVVNLERWAKRKFPSHQKLGETPPSAWMGAIDQVVVAGDVVTEVEFFHRDSRTLILTDLIENFEPGRVHSPFLRGLLRVAGIADPNGKTPIDMQLSFLRQRKAVRAAVEQMIAWNPARVIMAHGRWYDGNAVAELRRAFRWVL
jgi:hypothetical protein